MMFITWKFVVHVKSWPQCAYIADDNSLTLCEIGLNSKAEVLLICRENKQILNKNW